MNPYTEDREATTVPTISRTDLHVHSTASQVAKLGVQRALGLPECATPPQEVHALAKRRGMDFVTITDHDTISGGLELSHLEDTFLSEELTAWFRDEPQAVHVLCYGITPDDHEWLQAHRHDVEMCAGYLHEAGIACALAHPFYAVEEPLTPRHRSRLARLFPIWETRNGSRARELNLPAFVYIETHGGTGIGGSDDHAGVDIGRTFTETPPAATPAEFLAHVRAGRAVSRGDQGSAAKWAHAAIAIAVRALGLGDGDASLDPRVVLTMVERVMREGDVRRGAIGTDLAPDDARGLLRAWLASVELGIGSGAAAARELLDLLQDDSFRHADLFRRAQRLHERKLRAAVVRTLQMTSGESQLNLGLAAVDMFAACVPAIPYAPATAFLGREKAKLVSREDERPRVALIADGVGAMHGVTHTLAEIRERGVPGFDVEVIGTDASVDRRLAAVADVEVPYYAGLEVGVPSLPAIVETLSEGRYDLVHVCSPGPAGVAGGLLARVLDVPIVGSYHTELAAYAGLRSGQAHLETMTTAALAYFYGACRVVLSPSPASDERLGELGIPSERVVRWDRGVDTAALHPAKRREGMFAGELNVLYAGRLTHEKGADLLVDAFLGAHALAAQNGLRLHLVLAGGGPEEGRMRERLGADATFLGWLEGEELARAYASADMFLFASRTDTFGQVLLEAQASGLPVVAVDRGGPSSLISHGETGLLAAPEADALSQALVGLAEDRPRRERLSRAGLAAVRSRTWDRSLERLGEGYRLALARGETERGRRAA